MGYLIYTLFQALTIFYGVQLANGHPKPVIDSDPVGVVEEATLAEFPFIVSIGKKGGSGELYTRRQGHFCGGALVTKRLVVTSRHCLADETDMSTLRVLVGITRFTDESKEYNVEKWMSYLDWPNRLDTSDDHDIAVLKLTEDVTEDSVSTISVYPTNIDRKTEELVSVGWGKTKSAATSPVLLRIPLNIVTVAQCQQDLIAESQQNILVNLQHMCTRSPKKLVLGEGDSGGPIILKENNVQYLVGVNEAYCQSSTTRINTHSRISYYKNFINAMIAEF